MVGTDVLDDGEVHVVLVDPARVSTPAQLAACDALLTADERQKVQRFVYPAGRHECLVARALVRTTLSRYADVPPAAWRFVIGERGKPEIAPGLVARRLAFNLSHTHGLIACAVTWDLDVGVDVEWTRRSSETVRIADRFFSPLEVAALHALPEDAQRERFFAYWTLKESYIKARGLGLALPLDQFSFHLDDGGAIRISFDPRLGDEPRAWQFARAQPTDEHALAVALARGAAPDRRLVLEWSVPGGPPQP